MIDVSHKIGNESGAMAIDNYMKPQRDTSVFSKKTENALEIEEGINIKSVGYNKPSEEKSFAEALEEKSELDAKARKDQMIIISSTTAPEDCKKIEEDGFSMSESTGRTIITESDKIKAVLAKAGVDISAYGDGLSKEQLEEIVGNAAVAAQIEGAMSQASSLGKLTEDDVAYMLKNQLPPTIDNMYKAQYSSKEMLSAYQQKAEPVSDEDFIGMRRQVEEIIIKSGQKVDNQSLMSCRWLISNGIPLTSDNLEYYNKLSNYTPTKDDIAQAIAEAVAEGANPKNGMLIMGYSDLDKAVEAMEIVENAEPSDIEYCLENDQEITLSNLKYAARLRGESKAASAKRDEGKVEISDQKLTAQRKLAEVRLMMTVEANYSMLRRGISIDTKPLEELVDALKQQEQQYYSQLLSDNGVEPTEENIKVFSDVTTAFEEMKSYPAYAITEAAPQETAAQLHEKGAALKDVLDQANTRYETMMTAPRRDLGDSIKKAFSNVDDILKDLGYKTTEQNQRAVRILAYNSMELTPENIDKIKAADEEVQRAFKNMTPAVTLEMIRKGISPLDMKISELNQAALEIKNESGLNENERFSKYLWKLEQSNKITPEERESYIGIYRLIAQVEKGDGAALGAVIGQGTDVTMRNLLTAVRSNKKSGMDYKIDEEFSGVDSVQNEIKIDYQIMAAYSLNCVHDAMDALTPEKATILMENNWEDMTPEELKESLEQVDDSIQTQEEQLDKEYAKQTIAELGEAATASEDVYRIMERYDIPNSMANIIATAGMMKSPSDMFRKLDMIRDAKQLILERFGEAIKTPSELAKAQEELAEVATHAMDNMIIEDRSASTVDIKALKLMCKQFSIAAKEAKSESFVIPVETSDGVVTGISLKIVRGDDKKGMVDIFLQDEKFGKIAASFEAKENGITGVIAASDTQTQSMFEANLRTLVQGIYKEGQEDYDIRVAHIPDISSEKFEAASLNKVSKRSGEENSEQYTVQTSRLYSIAESFINIVRAIG